jgi:hypothetical protein
VPSAGDIIFASDLNAAVAAVAALKVLKPSDTSRASTVTSTADPDLLINLPAGTYYTLISNIIFNGDSTADMRAGFYVPSGGTMAGTIRAQNTSATTTVGSIVTDSQGPSGSFGFGCIGTGTNLTALIIGVVYSGSGGNFGWQWSQSVTSATATTVKANSFITLIPLA